VSGLISVAAAGRLSRALATPPWVALLVLFSVGLILSATLSPSSEAASVGTVGSAVCDLSRLSPLRLRELVRINAGTLNVVLFVPFGVALGRLPRSPAKVMLVAGGLALPFAVEGVQLIATQLGRACESGDVVDNLAGLLIGLVIGAVWARAAQPGQPI